MKKVGIYFLLLMLFMLAACASTTSNDGGSSAGGENGETINIDFSLFSTENDIFSTLVREWAERIEEETDGRVTFTLYYSGQLSSLYETLDSVKSGTIDGGALSAGAVSGDITSMSLLEPVGVLENEEAFKTFYENSADLMHDIFANQGLQLTFWTPGATQAFILHPDTIIKEPEQFKSLKFRSAGRWQGEQYELLGALPVNMDPGELYLALQNNTVDATIQTVNLTEAFKLYEVAPKMSLLKVPMNANIYVINQNVWDRISKEDQETIQKISEEVGLGSFGYSLEKEDQMIADLKKEGVEIYDLSEEEERNLLDSFQKIIPEIVGTVGEDGKELYEIIKQSQ